MFFFVEVFCGVVFLDVFLCFCFFFRHLTYVNGLFSQGLKVRVLNIYPMKRFMCKSKIHRATVTSTDKDYEGSISVCPELLDDSDILPFEKVHVWNVTNGKRFVTYAIRGEKGTVCVNGSAALLCHAGDIVIIASFGVYAESELEGFRQRVVFVDENNCVK